MIVTLALNDPQIHCSSFHVSLAQYTTLSHLNFVATRPYVIPARLTLRRKCARLTLLYKIIHNLTEIPNSYLPTLSPVTITRSNHEQKFLHYHTSIDNYKYSFFPRTIPEWNGLPQDIINQQTIDSFKQLLYNHF